MSAFNPLPYDIVLGHVQRLERLVTGRTVPGGGGRTQAVLIDLLRSMAEDARDTPALLALALATTAGALSDQRESVL